MQFIKLALKLYNFDIFIIIIDCCFCVLLLALSVCCAKTPDFLWAEQIAPHLIWTSLLPVFEKSHHAVGICRWEMRNAWEQKPAASSPSPFSRRCRVGLYQLLKKPPVWESLSSANGRQTPRRAVEIAWKRLKRDPDSVVSLAFHCSWQIQEGTLLMKTLKKHWMLMKTNNLILRCSWHRLWHDGTRKVLINRPMTLKLSYIVFTVKKKQ